MSEKRTLGRRGIVRMLTSAELAAEDGMTMFVVIRPNVRQTDEASDASAERLPVLPPTDEIR